MIAFLIGDELYYFNATPDIEIQLADDDYAREFLANQLGRNISHFKRVEVDNVESVDECNENNMTQENNQAKQNFRSIAKWDGEALNLFLSELSNYKQILRKGAAKTQRIYLKVARVLQQAGYATIRAEDCQHKLKNLLATYRRNVTRKKNGEALITWEYFDAMDEIFKTRARIYVPQENLIDTLDEEFVGSDNERENCAIRDTLEYIEDDMNVSVTAQENEILGHNSMSNIKFEEVELLSKASDIDVDIEDAKYARNSQQQRENDFMERFLKLSEERNEILREILNAIKSKS